MVQSKKIRPSTLEEMEPIVRRLIFNNFHSLPEKLLREHLHFTLDAVLGEIDIKEPDQFISLVESIKNPKFDPKSENYAASTDSIDYATVAPIIDNIYQRHGVFASPDVRLMLGTENLGISIGQLSAYYARRHHLKSKTIHAAGIYKSRTAYFAGRKRPLLLGEKASEYLEDKEDVSHEAIKRLTGLNDSGVKKLMVDYLNCSIKGKGANPHYAIQ